jgi:hypothetical protein
VHLIEVSSDLVVLLFQFVYEFGLKFVRCRKHSSIFIPGVLVKQLEEMLQRRETCVSGPFIREVRGLKHHTQIVNEPPDRLVNGCKNIYASH